MVIISSFYNEEYLLPWWLQHHKPLFTHGVLFDYYSTDRSVEIIKSICPTWEVRKTRNRDWSFADNDVEFMRAEQEFDGYKIVLTTTEFLMGVPELPEEKTCFGIRLRRIIDTDPENKPTYDLPLTEQKNTIYKQPRDKYKRRFLHNYKDGNYHMGRHSTRLPVSYTSDVLIYKYVFAPWNEEFIQRKLAMKNYMSSRDIEKNRGAHHKWDRDKLEQEYKKTLWSLAS